MSAILESFDHEGKDPAKRLLIEARNQADMILSVVERAPENVTWQQLRADERAWIIEECSRLARVKHGDDLVAIREATAAVDRATRRFAELMMESAITTAIRGKTKGQL